VRVVAPNREGGDAFGMGVGINSKTIAVAAMLESGASSGPKPNLSNNAASHSGAAYLFSQ
jgi:hypothetical protein